MKKYLEILKKIERKKHHPLVHTVHKKFGISRKTLFYVKEYGSNANVPRRIIKESLGILVLASIIASFGGFALEQIKTLFVSITPLIILLPALNGMIGDYGIIISSRFSTMLHEGHIKGNLLKIKELKRLIKEVFITALIASIFSLIISATASKILGFAPTAGVFYKIVLIVLINTFSLITILFATAIFAGLYFYKKQEDPNNFLIPITTSITDFGNMLILALLVILFF